jgi:hypothetical protein
MRNAYSRHAEFWHTIFTSEREREREREKERVRDVEYGY